MISISCNEVPKPPKPHQKASSPQHRLDKDPIPFGLGAWLFLGPLSRGPREGPKMPLLTEHA